MDIYELNGSKTLKRIYSKEGEGSGISFVHWKNHVGFGVPLGADTEDGQDVYSEIMAFKGHRFKRVLRYKSSNCSLRVGCKFKTLLVNSPLEGTIKIFEQNNSKYDNSQYTEEQRKEICSDYFLDEYVWNESSFKFELKRKKRLSTEEVKNYKMNNKLKYLFSLDPCVSPK